MTFPNSFHGKIYWFHFLTLVPKTTANNGLAHIYITGSYMNQWWPSLVKHTCFTRPWRDDDKIVVLCDTAHQISRGESADRMTTQQFYFLSRDIKTTKFNQYLPVVLAGCRKYASWKNSPHFPSDAYMRRKFLYFSYRSRGRPTKQCQANTPESRNVLNVTSPWYRIMTSYWHSILFIITANNVNCWADVANRVARLWHVGDAGNFKRRRLTPIAK